MKHKRRRIHFPDGTSMIYPVQPANGIWHIGTKTYVRHDDWRDAIQLVRAQQSKLKRAAALVASLKRRLTFHKLSRHDVSVLLAIKRPVYLEFDKRRNPQWFELIMLGVRLAEEQQRKQIDGTQ